MGPSSDGVLGLTFDILDIIFQSTENSMLCVIPLNLNWLKMTQIGLNKVESDPTLNGTQCAGGMGGRCGLTWQMSESVVNRPVYHYLRHL